MFGEKCRTKYNTSMRPETIDLLCNPYKGEPFILQGEELIGVASRQRFPIRHGIPVILDPVAQSFAALATRAFYDLGAFAYDGIVQFGARLGLNSETRVREDYIAALPAEGRVLEVGVGTSANLAYLPPGIDYFAIDNSFAMLRRAQQRINRLNGRAELFQADAAYLPFRDGTFDLVFQMGALQFIRDPFRSVSEMARLARPGTTVHILDEVRGAQVVLGRMPAHRKYAKTPKAAVGAIGRLVPHSMQNITSRVIAGTDFFALTFQKPPLPGPEHR